MKQTDINKELVQSFYKRVIGERDIDYASKIVAEDYIQHNPNIETGRAGLLKAIEFLKQLPEPKEPSPPQMKMIADGAYVAAHLNVELDGEVKSVVDVFKLQNGTLVEHWDAVMDISQFNISHDPGVGSVLNEATSEITLENKCVIANYSNEILINRQLSSLSDFISEGYFFHDSKFEKSEGDFMVFQNDRVIEKVHRVLGEGNHVFTQATGLINREKAVIYDIYRLKEKKIEEHWSVFQRIPEKMSHNNGMI
ncbi:MAG: nuclear transport factor 2 family protein [Bacteroidota bacterium]